MDALAKAGVKEADPTAQGINEILKRLGETTRSKTTGVLQTPPLLHGLANGSIQRLIVDFPAALGGDARRDVELLDGDQIGVIRQIVS